MTSADFPLPELPSGGAEITIVRWLKRPGESVAAGDPLLVAVNDRVEAALPATCDGILERVLAAEGAAVVAGAPVASIAAMIAANQIDAPDDGRSTTVEFGQATGAAPSDQTAPERTSRISPVARRIANLANIDITDLCGSGISGRIVKADVLAALASQEPRIENQQSIGSPAHPGNDAYVLTAIDVDMQRVVEMVARLEPGYARRGLELSYSACVALAAVAALPYYPLLNSFWAGDNIVVRRRVHLAALPHDSSPARVIRDAQDLNLRGLARGFGGARAVAAKTSHDSTFTIADLGDRAWGDLSALAHGRSAALGVSAVRARPLVIDDGGIDRLAVCRVALLTLAYDARVLDQCYADAYLRDVKRRLEQFDL